LGTGRLQRPGLTVVGGFFSTGWIMSISPWRRRRFYQSRYFKRANSSCFDAPPRAAGCTSSALSCPMVAGCVLPAGGRPVKLVWLCGEPEGGRRAWSERQSGDPTPSRAHGFGFRNFASYQLRLLLHLRRLLAHSPIDTDPRPVTTFHGLELLIVAEFDGRTRLVLDLHGRSRGALGARTGSVRGSRRGGPPR
jgi:hypothetical protein